MHYRYYEGNVEITEKNQEEFQGSIVVKGDVYINASADKLTTIKAGGGVYIYA